MAAVKTDKYKFTKMEKVVWKYSGIIIRNNIVRSGGIGRRTQYTCPVPSGSVSLTVNYGSLGYIHTGWNCCRFYKSKICHMSISVADFYCGFHPFQCSGVTSIVDVTQVALTLVRVSIEGSHDALIPKAKFGALLIISLPRVQRKFSKLQRRNALLDHCLGDSLIDVHFWRGQV